MADVKHESFEIACRDVALKVANIVIKKQHDYGHDNIMAFKEQGLVVRLSDKVARLKNLLQELEDCEAIHYDEQQRQFVGTGGQCPLTQGQPDGYGRKSSQQLQRNHQPDEG